MLKSYTQRTWRKLRKSKITSFIGPLAVYNLVFAAENHGTSRFNFFSRGAPAQASKNSEKSDSKGVFDWNFGISQIDLPAATLFSSSESFETFAKDQIPWLEPAQRALQAASKYFENVPDISLLNLAQVFQIEMKACQILSMDKETIEKEFFEANAKKVDKKSFEAAKICAYLSNLAYENAKAIRAGLKNMNYEVLQWEPAVGLHRPAYFIAFNPSEKLVVLVIKGTNSLEDMLTNVLHTPEMFLDDSYAHSGIAAASRFIIDRTLPILESLFLPLKYKILITGHSLGGGTAILTSVALKKKHTIDNSCIAIAPPPVLNKNATSGTCDYVMSVIHADDIIPRWNFGLVAAAMKIMNETKESIQERGYSSVNELLKDKLFLQKQAKLRHRIYADSASSQGEHNDMHLCKYSCIME